MDTTADQPADRLYTATYEAKMEASLKALHVRLAEIAPQLTLSEVYDMSCDDYSWSFTVKPDAASSDGDMLDVNLKLDEEATFEGEGEGLTFSLDMVWWGGEIAGGMAPNNYTDECWVDSSDEAAVAERYAFFEGDAFAQGAAEFIAKTMSAQPSSRG
jgi:hypothetical protein